jgi:hypothetical protein
LSARTIKSELILFSQTLFHHFEIWLDWRQILILFLHINRTNYLWLISNLQ